MTRSERRPDPRHCRRLEYLFTLKYVAVTAATIPITSPAKITPTPDPLDDEIQYPHRLRRRYRSRTSSRSRRARTTMGSGVHPRVPILASRRSNEQPWGLDLGRNPSAHGEPGACGAGTRRFAYEQNPVEARSGPARPQMPPRPLRSQRRDRCRRRFTGIAAKCRHLDRGFDFQVARHHHIGVATGSQHGVETDGEKDRNERDEDIDARIEHRQQDERRQQGCPRPQDQHGAASPWPRRTRR